MRRIHNLALSGIQFKMRQNIVNKLEKAGAIMKDKAVTIEEAELDLKEQNWLIYFAGAFLGKIQKTSDTTSRNAHALRSALDYSFCRLR